MTWFTISGAGTTTATKFHGDVMNKINNMFGGVDVSDTVLIHSNVAWTFKGTSFKISDSDDSHAYTILGGALSSDVNVTIPALSTSDTIGMIGLAQTITGIKTLDEGFIHKVVTAPSDPNAGYVKVYPKALDADNDGWFIKEEVAGSVVEVRIS